MEQTFDDVAAAVIPAIAMTDGELLMQYARHGDEDAFAVLVQKHGRLVWTVCWQVLRQHHEIEDAFQATFFILAKKARTIRSCDSLCGWLYRVAYRTALRARITSKRKPLLDLVADELESLDDKLSTIEQHEQRAVLLEELHSMPDQYQQALVSCYLEGKSRRQIAEELGCSLETIKGRLARGRQVLRHRLIRRGVSLSLAMGAMVIPAKAATAAVTPSLVGLTVSGAAGWAAGAAAVAKISTTVSSQVLQLAHQGTVAMTISSLAKPVVLGIALLGAVSGTLAVDSSEQSASGSAEQIIDLQASASAEGEASHTIEDDAVEIVMATEDGESAGPKEKRKFAFAFASGEKNDVGVTPPPSPKSEPPNPVKMRITPPADVLRPSFPRMPEVPVALPFNVRVPGEMSLKMHLKVAELESKVSQLQLESKELEIRAFDFDGEEKEKLIEASRRKLMEAEAETLRIQIEQQQARVKELEKAIEQHAEGLGKQAKKMIEARIAYEPEFSKMKLEGEAGARMASKAAKAAAEQARAAVEQAKGAAMAQAAQVADQARMMAKHAQAEAMAQTAAVAKKVKTAEAQSIAYAPSEDQSGALSLQPGDKIMIQARGVSPENPIDGIFIVEPMGTVALGVGNGRVNIDGLSILDAEKVIIDHLQGKYKDVELQVTYVGRGDYRGKREWVPRD